MISYTVTFDGYGNTFVQITVPRNPGLQSTTSEMCIDLLLCVRHFRDTKL